MKNLKINCGDIWLANMDPTVGSEINKIRPALILSKTDYNHMAETVTIIPITTGRYIPSLHVFIECLTEGSHAIIPQIRVASKQRIIKKVGKASAEEMNEIQKKLCRYLDITF